MPKKHRFTLVLNDEVKERIKKNMVLAGQPNMTAYSVYSFALTDQILNLASKGGKVRVDMPDNKSININITKHPEGSIADMQQRIGNPTAEVHASGA